jgi:hypothetical protein
MTTPEHTADQTTAGPDLTDPSVSAIAVDVPALVRHGGHHVTVDWRNPTEARRNGDGTELEPAVPAGFHVHVYPERAAGDPDDGLPLLIPVAEGFSPDWAEVWGRVFPTNMDASPVPLPDYSPLLRAGSALELAVQEAIQAALEWQDLPVGDDHGWTEAHRTAYDLARHTACAAVYALVDQADKWCLTLADLSEAAQDKRTPEPRDY